MAPTSFDRPQRPTQVRHKWLIWNSWNPSFWKVLVKLVLQKVTVSQCKLFLFPSHYMLSSSSCSLLQSFEASTGSGRGRVRQRQRGTVPQRTSVTSPPSSFNYLIIIMHCLHQVRQEQTLEDEETFARPPPPRRRPDNFQVSFMILSNQSSNSPKVNGDAPSNSSE